MSTRTPEDGRIRKRIAEIDQHIAVLHKERDELIFAERVLERLRDGSDVQVSAPVPDPAPAPAPAPATRAVREEPSEADSIEDALSKLEAKQFTS